MGLIFRDIKANKGKIKLPETVFTPKQENISLIGL